MARRMIGLVLAVCAAVLSFDAVAQTPEQLKGVAEAQKQAADRLKPKLPWVLDEYTTMLEAKAEGVVLVYTYRVDTSKVGFHPNFIALAKANSIQGACKPENMEMMKSGAVYRHRYLDSQWKPRSSFDIKLSDC